MDTNAFGVPHRLDRLYILMAVSFWRLWEHEPRSTTRSSAMTWFIAQLAINAAWSPVFFGWHGTAAALVIILALLLAIGMTIRLASRVDRIAVYLLVPYLAWVAYATTINAGVSTESTRPQYSKVPLANV